MKDLVAIVSSEEYYYENADKIMKAYLKIGDDVE